MTSPASSNLDPQLLEIFEAVVNLYNRENKLLESATESSASINATHFLVRQAIMFADAALFLMQDENQSLIPAAALLRTCLEAQARANHILGSTGEEREKLAAEFLDMMTTGDAYYRLLLAEWFKNWEADVAKTLSNYEPVLATIRERAGKVDTSPLKELRKKYQGLGRKWGYATVIGRDKLTDPEWQKRTGPQGIQPSLYLLYTQYCSFVHSDPTSLKHESKLNVLSEGHAAVLAAYSALTSFMTALGKAADADYQKIRQAMIAFQLVPKTLRIAPKSPAP
jgi:hypothetical protein